MLENIIEFFTAQLNDFRVEVIVRLTVSLILGLFIGIERELANKTAGLRTHILVCLGSTVFTLLSIYSFGSSVTEDGIRIVNDPARIAAQVVTGIGFIGGGAVLHHGANVFGLTTAATLWIIASIGMAVGSGSYFIAIVVAALTFIVLTMIRRFEHMVFSKKFNKYTRIKVALSCNKEHQEKVQNWFYNEFKTIHEISASKFQEKNDYIKLTYMIDIAGKDPVHKVHNKLASLQNIDSISLKQVLN